MALEDSPVAQAVHNLAAACGRWEGTATQLLETLKA